MTVEKFEILVNLFLDDKLGENKKDELYELLTNKSYYTLYEYYVGVWLDGKGVEEAKDINASVAYERFAQLVKLKEAKVINLHRYGILSRYAAIAVLIISLGFLGGRYWQVDSAVVLTDNVLPQVYSVPKGSQGELLLPDGTKVWMNSHTKIKYFTDYNSSERIISLEGEAFFDVFKDSLRPFIVHTGDLSIKALGTSFNVFTSSDEIITSLVEGCVEVSNDIDEKLILNPGNQARYIANDKVLRLEKFDVNTVASWKESKWIVRSMSLTEFAERLERKFNVIISITNPELKEARVSATLENESIHQIFEGLKSAFDIKVKETDSGFVIY